MYANLKMTIFTQGIHQNRLAKTLGIGESILSKIINGYREPSPFERKLLAGYFEVDEDWLFEKYNSTNPVHGLTLAEGARRSKEWLFLI